MQYVSTTAGTPIMADVAQILYRIRKRTLRRLYNIARREGYPRPRVDAAFNSFITSDPNAPCWVPQSLEDFIQGAPEALAEATK